MSRKTGREQCVCVCVQMRAVVTEQRKQTERGYCLARRDVMYVIEVVSREITLRARATPAAAGSLMRGKTLSRLLMFTCGGLCYKKDCLFDRWTRCFYRFISCCVHIFKRKKRGSRSGDHPQYLVLFCSSARAISLSGYVMRYIYYTYRFAAIHFHSRTAYRLL